MPAIADRIPKDWQALLDHSVHQSVWREHLEGILLLESASRAQFPHQIFPQVENVFNALWMTHVLDVKVVIIGQDPYHTPGLAHGLAFSIPPSIPKGTQLFPSSLRNMHKALVIEGFDGLRHGNLSAWAQQGVLLLNATLTVQQGLPHSHISFGWTTFTDMLIEALSSYRSSAQKNSKSSIVWLLWGGFAQKKESLISPLEDHLILKASHPSGLGVYRSSQPFLYPGDQKSCGHFKRSNEWLLEKGRSLINW